MTINRPRRGANALEFALVLPVLITLLMGAIDFGWYFAQESLVTNALAAAVRSGSALNPLPDEVGTCTPCIQAVKDHAVLGLRNLGISVDPTDIEPAIYAKAGTCAITLQTELPHTVLLGFIDTPATYSVPVITLAQNVTNCPAAP